MPTLSIDDLSRKNTPELRKLARAAGIESGWTTTARKSALISAIVEGKKPDVSDADLGRAARVLLKALGNQIKEVR